MVAARSRPAERKEATSHSRQLERQVASMFNLETSSFRNISMENLNSPFLQAKLLVEPINSSHIERKLLDTYPGVSKVLDDSQDENPLDRCLMFFSTAANIEFTSHFILQWSISFVSCPVSCLTASPLCILILLTRLICPASTT